MGDVISAVHPHGAAVMEVQVKGAEDDVVQPPGVVHGSLLQDWVFWLVLSLVIVAGIVLLACRLVMEFPGLVERRRKVSRTIRKLSRRGRRISEKDEENKDEEVQTRPIPSIKIEHEIIENDDNMGHSKHHHHHS